MTKLELPTGILVVHAAGMPIPKGSMKHIGNGRMVDQTKTKPWMKAIRKAALEEWNRVKSVDLMQPFVIDVPVSVFIEFYFPRPLAAKNRLYPHKRSVGDIDKLSRAVLDALQPTKTEPGVLADDSLVVDLSAHKRYSETGYAGAYIAVKELI
jgi:crossover junction endodeoxyribonuclease RusA